MSAKRHESPPHAEPRETPPAGAVDPQLAAFVRDLRSLTGRIARATPLPTQPLADLRELSETEDLSARFQAAASAAGCHVQRIAAGQLAETVLEIVHVLNKEKAARRPRSVYLQPQPGGPFDEAHAGALRTALTDAGVTVREGPDDETLFSVSAGITGVRLAVAETGSLVCTSGRGLARGASLIPPAHIAIVGESQIVPDLFDAFAALQPAATAQPFATPPNQSENPRVAATLPANINFITGPSKTADIEGVLVTGVHGPGDVHIVVIAGA